MNMHANAKALPLFLACAALMAVLLGGCAQGGEAPESGQAGSPAAPGGTFRAVEADEDGVVAVDVADLAEEALYLNYRTGAGVVVQMLAVLDASGAPHLALNTCQQCSPSPKAYFLQEGDAFVCQNCRQSFGAESVGASAAACNPTPLATLREDAGALLLDASELDGYESAFENWAGPVK